MKQQTYIPITDDFLFKTVFKEPDLLKQLLRRILPSVKIKDLNQVRTEDTLQLFDDLHGIRLDIAAANDRQMFNLEMQNSIADYPAKRARYSGDMIDVNSLPTGVLYDELKDCYVIVISPEDPFGEGELVYVAEPVIRKSGKPAKEGKQVIYVNCSGTKGRDEYPDLVPFCDYVMGIKTEDAFVNAVDEKVRLYNENKDWRLGYMEWEMHKLELINKGKKEGIPIGEKIGEIRGKKLGKKEGIWETTRLAVRKSYHRLRSLGIDEKQALQYVCEDYPELTDKIIRGILSV